MEKLLFNLKMKIKAEWDIDVDVDESTLKVIIQDEQRMKMFKEMGYV